MGDNNAQNLGAGDAIDYARQHPDQAEAVIDKAKDVIDDLTGGKYGELIDKGADMLEKSLGIPDDKPAPSPEPAEPSEPVEPTEPVEPESTEPEPGEPSGPGTFPQS